MRKNEHLELLTYLSRVPACVSDLAADLGCSELEIMSLVAQLRKSLEINVIVEHFTVCIDAKDWAVARTLAQQFMEPETDPSPSD